MDKQIFSSAIFSANAMHPTLPSALHLASRILLLLLSALVMNACEFFREETSPSPITGNPGANVSLAGEFADLPTDNSHRMLKAIKQTQSCPANKPCTQTLEYEISYSYLPSGQLDTVEAFEFTTEGMPTYVMYHKYHYVDSNRLDKVSVSLNDTDNFHTLHDYSYDDENDLDFTALILDRPKLRKEYICEIDVPQVTGVTTEICDRSNANYARNYIYTDKGYLYRKEEDVNNDTQIDHQKIYYYKNNGLTRVDTDNFYNGYLDERYEYEFDADFGLRVFFDNNFFVKPRAVDIASSYRLGYQENTIASDKQKRFPFSFYINNAAQITVTLNGNVLPATGYAVTDLSPNGGIVILVVPAELDDKLQLSAYDTVTSKECYFNGTTAQACANESREDFHWIFTWEEGDCWAGGLDDIAPEARAIDQICKQKD